MATASNPAELKDTLAQYEAQYDQVKGHSLIYLHLFLILSGRGSTYK